MTKVYDHTDAQAGRAAMLREAWVPPVTHLSPDGFILTDFAVRGITTKHNPLDTSLLPERIGY
jgi:hypothetical protein